MYQKSNNMINQLKISLLFCLMLAFTSVDAQENITQQKYQLPLLIGKDFNPVLRLAVNISKDKTLNELEINVPTNGADIDQVQLFALDQDTAFITTAKLEKLSPIATVNGNSSKVLSLKLNKALKSGEHFFWLTLKLKNNADLQHKINLTIGAAVLDGKKVKVNPVSKPISQYVA
ncbi:MAG: hypothetical protein EOO92_15255, partial [Pedobacter sp.]